MKIKNRYFILIIFFILIYSSTARSQSDDESALFNTLSPDALILFDLSGSMNWTPPGQIMYIASSQSCDASVPFYGNSDSVHTKACTIDPGSVPKWSTASCTDPFYKSSGTGHTTDCSRIAIAKRALFSILDDTNNGTIDSQDEKSLNIRFGYMRFTNCSGDEGGNYSSGCNTLVWGISTKYSNIYCKNTTKCTSSSSSSGSISGESASGGTPLASALKEAKLYLDYQKSTDSAKACRSKFVILITDGGDTYACGGDGSETQTDQYKRRRAVVAQTKALADAGYKVFVIGFGAGMPLYLQNTLNWMAFHGGTDNPLVDNSGNTAAYNPSSTTLCQTSTTSHHDMGDGDYYYATTNDPSETALSGYAFLAFNADDLVNALAQAVNSIREAPYCFSTVSVASSRAKDENFIYEASFEPFNVDPFWDGHLKKYNLNSDGTLADVAWDAGTVLKSTTAASRNILTLINGSLVPFTTGNTNITNALLGGVTDTARTQIIGYFRGDPTYNPDNWKLGDIFHSNPVTVGSPSSSFNDIRDANLAFVSFRNSHPRTSANGARVVITPANDGQVHAFKAIDGTEVWSLIPPNLLPKLKNVAHATDPTSLIHDYFVDGPVSVADAWLGNGNGLAKSSSDWKTLAIIGEGRGASTYLWSSSSSCTSGLTAQYTSGSPYYCGYYTLDITNTANPAFKWVVNADSTTGPYLGAPWSRLAMGRIKISGNEKWVGFFGGGYNATDCTDSGSCDTRGKGFFVVDLSNGSILWSYTRANDNTMNYSLPGAPAIIDSDYDGFIDTAYIGDTGGNIWRFKFCTVNDGPSCNSSNWSGGSFFVNPSGTNPIFSTPTLSRDQFGNSWVFWGTGDKTDPMVLSVQEKFFAVKDNYRSGTYQIGQLQDITSSLWVEPNTQDGWYIRMTDPGEKILADPTIFAGVAYFSSYAPDQSGDPLRQAGTAKLYAVAVLRLIINGIVYDPGAGVLSEPADPHSTSGGARRIALGVGIPTAPILSFKPSGELPPDMYITVSGGSGVGGSTMRAPLDPPFTSSRTNILYWKDGRVN